MSQDKQLDLWGNVMITDPLLNKDFKSDGTSIFDTKTGEWQSRKKEWKSLGIKSEVGRDVKTFAIPLKKYDQENMEEEYYGDKAQKLNTSIFDPVLCEVLYRHLLPGGGKILDPFAGGSVRGIVAHYLGYDYTGIDIRPEQIKSNQKQAVKILDDDNQPLWIEGDSDQLLNFDITEDIDAITPIEKRDGIYFKRDDKFMINNSNGGKTRTCYALIKQSNKSGVVTAGSRKSPQIGIVAKIAKQLNKESFAHCPQGKMSDVLIEARDQYGINITQEKAGYNTVIMKRAKDAAEKNDLTLIPFGMECWEAINQTRNQVKNIPDDCKRVVAPVGSGMSFSGILHGLKDLGLDIPVLGLVVGADPSKRLDKYAPEGWRDNPNIKLVNVGVDYHTEIKDNCFKGIYLDPIYEAKCIKFIKPGDLFWIVGNRYNIKNPLHKKYDMVFSCPPYADLEKYSDLEGDISNMKYKDFFRSYSSIIKKSCRLIKTGGFACFVVGEVRDKSGNYIGFVPDTIRSFEEAGMQYYNEIILLNHIASASMRADRQFSAGKKLVKIHQNVLIFKKV